MNNCWHNDIVRSHPEFSTRLDLLDTMDTWTNLRRAILNTIDHMWQIAFIPDPPVAIEMLDLYWAHVQQRFNENWQRKLKDSTPTIHEGHVLWAQCKGVLRNVYRNVGVSLGRKPAWAWNEHDVMRGVGGENKVA